MGGREAPQETSSAADDHEEDLETLADTRPERTVYSHKLDDLVGLAGIKAQLQGDMKNDAILSASWGVASKWNETSRYQMWDQFAARSMIDAVGDPNHGVLQWLKKHW